MDFARDAVEMTGEYRESMEEIRKIPDREFPADRVAQGTCHQLWARGRNAGPEENMLEISGRNEPRYQI